MYLDMNEQDYRQVLEEAPRIVAGRLHIDETSAEEIVEAIRGKDALAAGLLEKFMDAYREWWQASVAAGDTPQPTPESVSAVRRLITKRSEMRAALISYLNSQYPVGA